MKSERDKLYTYITSEGSHPRNLPRAEFDAQLEKQKAYTMERLATRRCPMTLEGAAKVAGGYSPGNTERVSWRFRIALDELVEEGRLAETHRPDGNDTYHIPGGKWDPVIISPAEADLIAGLETYDPQLQELQKRLETEAAARTEAE